MNNATTKICRVCGETKSVSEFYKRSDVPGGFAARCKVCVRKQSALKYRERKGLPLDEYTPFPGGVRRKHYEKPCANCGESFLPRGAENIYCSTTCNYEAKQIRDQRPAWQVEMRICVICGDAFVPRRVDQGTCTTECADAYRVVSRIDTGHRRRERIKSTRVAPINPKDVYRRDQWVCGLCGEVIDEGLNYPHPMSASLDHIVPLSRGGVHQLHNVQASHLRCNLRKYNHLEEVV